MLTERNVSLKTASTIGDKIRVLIMDDHAVVRQGLRMFIEMQGDMEIFGEVSNGNEAVDWIAKPLTGR